MRARAMRRFWDRRAREDPFYFVDSRLTYRRPDLERFWTGEESVDVVFRLLGVSIQDEDEVVEIGCGLGRMTRALAARARSVRALDISPRMLEQAQELNPHLDNVAWILGDGETLRGIGSASADVCFSEVVFQHIPEPEITLGYVREMGRVLRPGGWAGFQVSNLPSHERPAQTRLRHLLRSATGRGPRGLAHRAWVGSPIELDRLRETAEESGLLVERIVGEGTQFCHVLLRRLAGEASAAEG